MAVFCTFQGKTLFYVHHFSQTHEWISPRELFEADPSLSLRAVILKVVKVINKVSTPNLTDYLSMAPSLKELVMFIRLFYSGM